MFNRLKNSVLALSALPSLAYSQMFSFEPDCEKMGSTVVPSPDKMDFSPINHAASTLGNALVSIGQDICQMATTNFTQSLNQDQKPDSTIKPGETFNYTTGIAIGAVALVGLYCTIKAFQKIPQSIKNWWNKSYSDPFDKVPAALNLEEQGVGNSASQSNVSVTTSSLFANKTLTNKKDVEKNNKDHHIINVGDPSEFSQSSKSNRR